MPSAGAWVRGQLAAEEIIRQHGEANGGRYPETTAVTLWGLDTIKTRGKLKQCDALIDTFLSLLSWAMSYYLSNMFYFFPKQNLYV